MRIETSQIVITTEERFDGDKAPAFRGFLGTLFKAVPAFHGHDGRWSFYLILIVTLTVAVGGAVGTGFVVEHLSTLRPDLLVQ